MGRMHYLTSKRFMIWSTCRYLDIRSEGGHSFDGTYLVDLSRVGGIDASSVSWQVLAMVIVMKCMQAGGQAQA